MEEKILVKIGFTKNEAKVYLALLELGTVLVSKVSEKTKISRRNVYEYLETLKERGIISQVTKENRKYFSAKHPEALLNFLKEKEDDLKSILPSLVEKSKLKEEPTEIEVFKGVEGLKTVLNDIIVSKANYNVVGAIKKFEEILSYYLLHGIKKFDKLRLKERAIIREGEKIIPTKYSQYRYLPKNYDFPTSFLQYQDKVILVIWDKPFYSILIQNKSFSKTYKAYFEILWSISKLKI